LHPITAATVILPYLEAPPPASTFVRTTAANPKIMSSPDDITPPPPISPPIMPMQTGPTKRRLKRVAPLSVGKIGALVYGAIGLIFVPFFLIMAAVGAHSGMQHHPFGPLALGAGFAIAAPFMYAAMGFIGGVISAALYNLFAKWVGGIEVEVE